MIKSIVFVSSTENIESKLDNVFKLLVEKEVQHELVYLKPFLEGFDRRPDLLVSIGGDGTFLAVANYCIQQDIPILGINSGNLGFLTSASLEELVETINLVLNAKICNSSKSFLKVKISDNDNVLEHIALNEVVLHSSGSAKSLNIDLQISDEEQLNYSGDGLIVSTQTGSTAYNYSAGGPVIKDGLDCLLLTPICSLNRNHSSLVLSHNTKVSLGVTSHAEARVTIDGSTSLKVSNQTLIEVLLDSKKLLVLENCQNNLIKTLKNRLGW